MKKVATTIFWVVACVLALGAYNGGHSFQSLDSVMDWHAYQSDRSGGGKDWAGLW